MSAAQRKEEYLETKGKVLHLLERTQEFYAKEGFADKATAFGDLYKKLQDGEFSIVVVGEFSTGKSTLLNALMGKRILPSFSSETTATVNFLRHVEKASSGEAGCVYYASGETKILPQADLATVEAYVSTKGDNVVQSVDHLDLFMDSDFLRDGVMLVDSPGLNGIAAGHKEVTEEQILKSHASIFLFTSDHPGSKTDFDVLRDLSRQVKTIFIVLNKIDVIKHDEGETVDSVIATIKENYNKVFQDADESTTVPEIWPVSARKALRARDPESEYFGDKSMEETSLLPAFEERLMRFLTLGEKAIKELMAPLEHIIDQAGRTKAACEREKADLSGKLDGDEIEQQITALQAEIQTLDEQVRENRGKIRSGLAQAFREINNELSAAISKVRDDRMKTVSSIEEIDELNDYIAGFEDSFLRAARIFVQRCDEQIRERIRDIAYTECISNIEQIEAKMTSSEGRSIQFTLKEHLNTQERICEFDFDVMRQRENELSQQIKALDVQNRAEGDGEDDLHLVQEKKRKLDDRIRDLRASRSALELRQLPPIGGHEEDATETRDRNGVVGFFGQILLGKKEVRTKKWVEDRSEHDSARAEKAAGLKRHDIDIQEKEKSMAALEAEEARIRNIRKKHLERRARIEHLEEDLQKLHKENIEKMERQRKQVLRKCKRELEDFCDGIHDDIMEQSQKMLREARDAYTTNLCEVVEQNLRNSMQEKIKYMESIQKKLATSVSEKQQQIDLLDQRITALDAILNDTIDLKTELSSMQVDTIRQSVICQQQ